MGTQIIGTTNSHIKIPGMSVNYRIIEKKKKFKLLILYTIAIFIYCTEPLYKNKLALKKGFLI